MKLIAIIRTTLKARVDEFVAADLDLALVGMRSLLAGIREETPEYNDANDRVCDAETALPFWLRRFAERRSWRDHGALWEACWVLEDVLA
ncbi:MAG TPA: hypothetical protein VIP06_02945 [Nocardioides sp.]